jgi:hypothetical protein
MIRIYPGSILGESPGGCFLSLLRAALRRPSQSEESCRECDGGRHESEKSPPVQDCDELRSSQANTSIQSVAPSSGLIGHGLNHLGGSRQSWQFWVEYKLVNEIPIR